MEKEENNKQNENQKFDVNQDGKNEDITSNYNEDVKKTPEEKTPEEKTPEEKTPEEKTPEEKILNLEDKLARTFAEMENQRRRFEREKEEAFDYGGYSFAKEALNLID